MARRVVDVLVPVALDQAYSYTVPPGMEVAPGDVVAVPLGPRESIGVVWAENENPNPRLDNRLKDISEKLDVPPLKAELRKVIDWVSAYTLSARGMVMRMSLRMREHLPPARERIGVRLAGPPPKRMTAARNRALALVADGLVRSKGEIAEEAGVTASVIDGLIDEGTLETLVLAPEPVARTPDPDFVQPEFAKAQRDAADALRATIEKGGYSATLLDGVTGSGKTAVYLEAVAETHPPRQAGADPDAGDRAHRAVARSLRRALRRAPGGMALAVVAAPARAHLGARCRQARRRSRSARARRCSCPMPISGSSSSMRSTTPPTSRKTACATMRATWPWCARTSLASRSCFPRQRPRSRPKSMRDAVATSGCICPSASAASICRGSRRSI